MPMHATSLTSRSCVVLALLLIVSAAQACPIPVFQYSLEHWEADPYDLVIHHNGSLTEPQQAVIDKLKAIEQREQSPANITVIVRDHSQLDTPAPSVMELPYVEVRYPVISGIRGALLHLPLTERAMAQLLDSPMRQKIAEQLLDRKAAVWVLLNSGDERKDRDARRMLDRELPRLERTLKVPDPTEEWGIDLGDIHTEIHFATLTLDRKDAGESVLITSMLGIERDLKDYSDEPIVFPIYGRGLVMYALIGKGINERTINGVGEFLTGPCSCQIKSGNPGTDLLLSVDWDAKVEARTQLGVPAAAGIEGFVERLEDADNRLDENRD